VTLIKNEDLYKNEYL